MTRPLLSYYGDDFTGSTDVMEALSGQGVETVLFPKIPDERLLSRFAHCRAFGLAGTSRSESPDWMEIYLRQAFEWLQGLKAEICHYKVCSTFDSSPTIGSIGKAIEIGRQVFDAATVPLIVGAPQIRRYTAFGHLFAAYQGRIYRIDRHPVMSRHPVTPMAESDLLLHLAEQTDLSSALADNVVLKSAAAGATVAAHFEAKIPILLIDVDDLEGQVLAGRQVWRNRAHQSQFVCGSSGVEYALVPEWRKMGLIGDPQVFAPAGPVNQIAVVSGSVSPTTERQILHAQAHGFDGVALDAIAFSAADSSDLMEQAVQQGLDVLKGGRSPIFYTALGPAADKGALLNQSSGSRHRLGQNLGRLLKRLTVEAGLGRVVVAGGDTSSHALGEMGIEALTLCMPLPQTPGSPLCTAHSVETGIDGLQIALKGGQVGNDDYFSMIRSGIPG